MKLTFEYRFYADSFCLCVFEKKKKNRKAISNLSIFFCKKEWTSANLEECFLKLVKYVSFYLFYFYFLS